MPLADSTLVGSGAGIPVAGVPASAASAPHDRYVGTATLNVDSLIALALARRPDLIERGAVVREASAQVSVARREAFPNLVLRGSSERVEGGATRQLRPGLG